jgi:spermidine synthase
MSASHYRILFFLFLISGFCGLLYQVVWVRMAYASFGVITPVLSVVISVFMLGLSIGSWYGGKWVDRVARKTVGSPLRLYAAAEALLGVGAFVVPALFGMWRSVLYTVGEMNSVSYLLYSALMISVSILPWCIFMGVTFPFMMAFIRNARRQSESSFSYLYFANVIGAMFGTVITAVVIIELVGFKNTLFIAACLNFGIAGIALLVSRGYTQAPQSASAGPDRTAPAVDGLTAREGTRICVILFMTGFISLSMEVVWVRAFTIVLRTATYSFAALLAVYLLATWVGSYLYRRHLAKNRVLHEDTLLSSIALFSLLPLALNDPRFGLGAAGVLGSIFPFCAVLGYLTPKLIDRYAAGDPLKGGKAYALNIVGCILGPLVASYGLLPVLGVKVSFLLLSAPFLFLLVYYFGKTMAGRSGSLVMTGAALLLFLGAAAASRSYEENYVSQEGAEVRRDYTATVVSHGEGMGKQMLVNGVGITKLTPVTKAMAHLPLAFCKNKPESALVVCFGMGTTYRSLMSWGVKVTAVELVPSVRDAFGFYFTDADRWMDDPRGRVVIDDGRRFLARTTEMFDVITIDPPPPIETAGSSLLYSEEFYALIKKRLKKGGILQAWIPVCELKTFQAAARSLLNSFPHVRVFTSLERWGAHFLVSSEPIPDFSLDQLVARMPPAAQADLVEWYTDTTARTAMAHMVIPQVDLDRILSPDPEMKITDDRPYNEYYLLRRLWDRAHGEGGGFRSLPFKE